MGLIEPAPELHVAEGWLDTGERVTHYAAGRYNAQQVAEQTHDGVVLEWVISSPAGSIEGHAIVRWIEDGTYHVVNIEDLLYRPPE